MRTQRWVQYGALGAGSALLTSAIAFRAPQVQAAGWTPLPLVAAVGVPAIAAQSHLLKGERDAALEAAMAGFVGQWVAGTLLVGVLAELGMVSRHQQHQLMGNAALAGCNECEASQQALAGHWGWQQQRQNEELVTGTAVGPGDRNP